MKHNIAFIDAQNLHIGTLSSTPPWKISFLRFRTYLKEKYSVEKAYFYIGYFQEENKFLYENIERAGFIIKFRKHNTKMTGSKKGNVDSDIIFDIMKKLYKKEEFDNIILVSGDGDFRMVVDFLLEENRFEKILFPNARFSSSLYKHLPRKYTDALNTPSLIKKIGVLKVKKGP